MAEIFTTQVRFYGKHAQYLEALLPPKERREDTSLNEIERNKYLFDTWVDIYAAAPIVGFLFQQKAPRETSDYTRNIFVEQLNSHKDQLCFSYALVMICDKASEPDLNERIRKAFRATDELVETGMELFNDYARGGIEILYEKLIHSAATPEDLIRNAMDFTEEWSEKFLSATSDIDLDKLLRR